MKRGFGGVVFGVVTGMVVSMAGLLAGTGTAEAAITPSTGADDNSFNGNCTLREAIRSINEGGKVDSCTWVAGETTVHLTARTYAISAALGAISVTAKTISVAGLGHRVSIIDLANGGGEAFSIAPSLPNGTQVFTDFIIRNSSSTAFRTGTDTKLTLNRIKIENMGALEGGRACIRIIAGQVTLQDGEMKKCRGTGVSIAQFAAFSLKNSTISESFGERGGAIHNAGSVLVSRSTLGANYASAFGGAVANISTGIAMIYGSTIVYNTSALANANSGALHNAGVMTIEASILAHNLTIDGAPANCRAITAITSNGYNTVNDQTGKTCIGNAATDAVANPQLLTGSGNVPYPAGGVGAVYPPSNSVLSRVPATHAHCKAPDQRGLIRSRLPTCHVGAVERFGALVVTSAAGSNCDLIVGITITSVGGTYTTVSDTASDPSMAANRALVVISESVTSSNVNTKFRDIEVPVLNMEPLLVDDMRMTGPTENTHYGVFSGTTITMNGVRGTMNELPHRFGMLQGNLVVNSSSLNYGWTKAPTGATPIISAVGAGDFAKNTIMVYPGRDLTMYNGFKSKQARLAFFPNSDACASLNADGQRLLMETLVYAASF